jgi:DNA-binding NarL/FixJ family response regulator
MNPFTLSEHAKNSKTPMNKIRSTVNLLIIEDNRYVREGWKAVLSSVDDINVIGAYSSCERAFASKSISEADVIVMDIGLPGMSGIEGVRYARQYFPDIAVIMCTVYEEEGKIFDALCAGAVGYMLKKIPPADLIKAIRDAAAGGSPMTPAIARKIIRTFHQTPPNEIQLQTDLTPGEIEVLNLLAVGKSYTAIAEEIFLSIDGVRARIRKIYEKLQAHTRGEAVAKGISQKIINPPTHSS